MSLSFSLSYTLENILLDKLGSETDVARIIVGGDFLKYVWFVYMCKSRKVYVICTATDVNGHWHKLLFTRCSIRNDTIVYCSKATCLTPWQFQNAVSTTSQNPSHSNAPLPPVLLRLYQLHDHPCGAVCTDEKLHTTWAERGKQLVAILVYNVIHFD